MQEQFVLKLYVTGNTSRSQRAIANLRRFCEQALPERYDIRIIDIQEQPQIAEQDKILITPTLVKEKPLPQERIIGDLSDQAVLLRALNIVTSSSSS